MRFLLKEAVLGAALIFAVAGPSQAYTIDGNVNQFHQYASGGFVSGLFSDAYSFSLTQTSDVNASFTGNPGGSFELTDFALYALDGTRQTTTFDSAMIFQNFQAGTDTVQLDPGSYFVGVTGTSSSSQGTYTGTLAISAVPLPPSLALFGAAVIMVGAAGAVHSGRSRAWPYADR